MGRRRKKASVVRRAETNTIRIIFYWRDKRIMETLRVNDQAVRATPKNLTFAARLAEEIDDKIARGNFIYADYFPRSSRCGQLSDNTSFRAYATAWLKGKRAELKKASIVKYEQILNQMWFPPIGDKVLKDIKRSDISKAIGEAADWSTLSPKRWNDALIPLRGVFDLALDDELITVNPAAKLRNKTPSPRPADPLSYQEVLLILDDMTTHYPPQAANAFATLFFSAIRPGELIALAWPNVDLINGYLRIAATRNLGVEGTPKNGKQRDVKLTPRALSALKQQQPWTQLLGGKVFHHPQLAKPYHEIRPLRELYFEPTLRRLGLRHRDMYQTRHTCASLALMAGVHPTKLAAILGDHPRLIYETYAKWIEEDYDASTIDGLTCDFADWLRGARRTVPKLCREGSDAA